MVRSEPVTGYLLRLYPQPRDDPRAKYSAVCFVDCVPGTVPEIKGMSGARYHRHYTREIAQCLAALGIPVVRAQRALGHVLPDARAVGEHFEWVIADVLAGLRPRA